MVASCEPDRAAASTNAYQLADGWTLSRRPAPGLFYHADHAHPPASPATHSPMPSGPATPRPRRQLRAWLDDRPLDDANLAAYVGHLHQTGRSPATAAMAVAAVTRAASDAGEAVPVGPFTRHAIEGFRRTAAGDAPPRRGQARGLTADECATVLATCLRPRRTGRGPRVPEDRRAPRPDRRRHRRPALPRAPSAAARWSPSAGPTSTCPTATTS